jgi:hypothetical protein
MNLLKHALRLNLIPAPSGAEVEIVTPMSLEEVSERGPVGGDKYVITNNGWLHRIGRVTLGDWRIEERENSDMKQAWDIPEAPCPTQYYLVALTRRVT